MDAVSIGEQRFALLISSVKVVVLVVCSMDVDLSSVPGKWEQIFATKWLGVNVTGHKRPSKERM